MTSNNRRYKINKADGIYIGIYSEKDFMSKEYESEVDQLSFRVMQFINTKIKTLKVDPTVLFETMHVQLQWFKKNRVMTTTS